MFILLCTQTKIYSTLMKILAMSYSCNEMGTFNKDPNNINLNDNFDEDDPDTFGLAYWTWWTQST